MFFKLITIIMLIILKGTLFYKEPHSLFLTLSLYTVTWKKKRQSHRFFFRDHVGIHRFFKNVSLAPKCGPVWIFLFTIIVFWWPIGSQGKLILGGCYGWNWRHDSWGLIEWLENMLVPFLGIPCFVLG